MANRFSINPPNPLEALMAGVQGYEGAQKRAKQGDIEAGRQEAVQALQSGGDTRGALARLIGVGDIQGANAIAQYAENQANRGFREQQAQRSQQNADRSFGLQQQQFGLAQRQADIAAKGFDYKEVDDGQGGKTLVRIEKATGNITRPEISGAPSQPTNPFAYGKQNEAQSKDSGFANRMFRAENVLRDPKVEAAATDPVQYGLGKLPGIAANYATNKEYQKFDQAQRDFINATLRRESGAAIAESEFENARKQYFPQPGDSPEKIAEKRKNRQDAIASVAGGGGPAYRPPFTFSETGDLVPTGQKQGVRTAQPQGGPVQPTIGETRDGYRYKGGDPASPASWVALK